MSEAAPQAAGSSEDVGKALEVLRLLYDDSCTFGHDAEHGYWVIKNGKLGSILLADSPEKLVKKLDETEGTGL